MDGAYGSLEGVYSGTKLWIIASNPVKKYWVAQNICLDFSITSYGKTQPNFVA